MTDKQIDRIFAASFWGLGVTFALMIASGFYAMTSLPYASVIASWWR